MESLLNTYDLYNKYEYYKESSLVSRRFGIESIIPLIEKLKANQNIEFIESGKSILQKPLYSITIGKGNIRVLMWSQMHGDEPTATMALFDMLKFCTADDEFNYIRNYLFENLTIKILPMLNPDGAEKFTRENAAGIDLNRDAVRLQSPESVFLRNLQDQFKPEFGFNLHDQNSRYTAGKSFKSASISLLAPPFNHKKKINSVREKSIKVIVDIHRQLQKYIPGHIARYNDDFEPRAFGDNFVRWGTSTILIESGGWKDDANKDFIRKMNFLAFISGLYSIASETYKGRKVDSYYQIPENDKLIFDLLLKNLRYKTEMFDILLDVGINREEITDNGEIYYKGLIDDIGDLSTFYGYEEYDLTGHDISVGDATENVYDKVEDISEADLEKYLGGTEMIVKVRQHVNSSSFKLPFLVVNENEIPDLSIKQNNIPFFNITQQGVLKYKIINGFFTDVNTGSSKIINGLISGK